MKRLLFCFTLLYASGVLAQDKKTLTPEEKKPLSRMQRKLVETNIRVSERIDKFADGLDMFLVRRRLTTRKNETFIRIENSTFVREYRDAYNETQFNANIMLPNFEEYWQLKFSSYDEHRERREINRSNLRRSPRERNVGATLGLFRKLGNVRTTFQPRVEFRNPVLVSHSLSFESVAESEIFKLNPKFELYADASRGVGLFQVLNLNIGFTRVWDLTLINQGDYEERLHKYSVTNGLSVGQMLDEKRSLSYNLFFLSVNRPNYHLQEYSVGITWSQVILKKILDYQITPYVAFERAMNFTRAPGLTFDLNLTF